MNNKIIGGVFSNVGSAEQAITELQRHGYGSNDISVFAKDKSKVNVLEEEMETSVTSNKGGRGKNAGKGAGLGALSGGALGGIGGLIAGLGLLAIPGIGQLAAAGPIAAALTGAGVGAGGGGIVGALVGAGMPERDAKQYENHLKDGKIIVIVEASDKVQDKVYRIFLSNKTENKSMYPDHYQNHDHDHTSHYSTTTNNQDGKTTPLKDKAHTESPNTNFTNRTNETRTRSSERHHSSRTRD
ncbi:low temperature-induced protein [Pseudalkalibacillus hwajinpoensis]|uniref:low temperature-induced protein n=1 Tax=Guptibacillus hwajinpoensis TaxID=208199 RepID=UPI00325BA9A8